MLNIEEVENLRPIPQDLLDFMKEELLNQEINSWERDSVENWKGNFKGMNLSLELIEESGWDDEGKYQYNEKTYLLGVWDLTGDAFMELFNLVITQQITRSGSYFTDYYYQYNCPVFKKYETTIIPRKIIEEHAEVILTNI